MFGRRRRKPALIWGVRTSLTRYVAGMPDGIIQAIGAADVFDEHGTPRFLFPETDREGGVVRFAGAASISGHGGLLRVEAIDPWLHAQPDHVELTILPRPDAARIAVARIPAVTDVAHGWTDAVTVLTADGAGWLGGHYTEGEEAAPLSYRV